MSKRKKSVAKRKVVRVFLEGGVIHDIRIPPGVSVEVYDYDTEGVDAERIATDAKGDECVITVWK